MKAFLVAAALALSILAGCTSPSEDRAEDLGDRAELDPSGLVFDGAGRLVDLDALPSIAGEMLPLPASAFEPTLGVAPDGTVFFATVGSGVAVGWSPDVHRSRDGGVTWESVGPRLPSGQTIPPETNDPYVYVDPTTGRVFQFAMAPILLCSILSFSDDQGETWTTNPRGCGISPPWDHQTIVAAPPRGVPTVGYDNVVVTCVNTIWAIQCATSLDGGMNFLPAVPASVDGSEPCGTTAQFGETVVPGPASSLHGHLKASPDGILYIPEVHCGISRVHVSDDSGLTWTTREVATLPVSEGFDPVAAVDAAGTVYFAVTSEDGPLLLFVSKDMGATWSDPVTASPPGVSATLPAMAAAGPGQVALAYPGTDDLRGGFRDTDNATTSRWTAYVTVSGNADQADATFQSLRVHEETDPLVIGRCGNGNRCPGMVDFIDVAIHEGTVYGAFVDVCREACAEDGEDNEDLTDGDGEAQVARVRSQWLLPAAPAA